MPGAENQTRSDFPSVIRFWIEALARKPNREPSSKNPDHGECFQGWPLNGKV